MALRIITADERMAQAHEKTSIFLIGPPKCGKTSQLFTLDPATTLVLDFEAGMKSVETWKGDSVPLRTIGDTWDIACLVGGPNPAVSSSRPFSQAHYDTVAEKYRGTIDMQKYRTVFFDSISDLSQVMRLYAEQQPASFNKHGIYDPRGMYGELGRNLVDLLTHMQHAPLTVIFVGKLDQKTDDANRITYESQMQGQMAARILPGLVDFVVTMSLFDYYDEPKEKPIGWVHNFESGTHRAFCCHRLNPWGLPAGGRSLGQLELIEEPNLGKLIDKINAPARLGAEQLLNHGAKANAS